jgi:hypothetical protein
VPWGTPGTVYSFKRKLARTYRNFLKDYSSSPSMELKRDAFKL